jgi:hypothetical protein
LPWHLRTAEAFRELVSLANRVWELDGRLAGLAAGYWDDPDAVRTRIGFELRETFELQRELPHEIVKVLQRGSPVEGFPSPDPAPSELASDLPAS